MEQHATLADHRPRSHPKKPTVKTIKDVGASVERVAQACDRCRAKKTKCDGKLPACSTCVAVGFTCVVSDKLSRRAFPKGYTETLEERIRQLEIENRRISGLLNLRDEQLEVLNSGLHNDISDDLQTGVGTLTDHLVTSSNLARLEGKNGVHDHAPGHVCPCGCLTNAHAVHERPVSIAGAMFDDPTNGLLIAGAYIDEATGISIAGSVNLSDSDDESLPSVDDLYTSEYRSSHRLLNREVSPAPGAFAAATAIAQMQGLSDHELDESNKQQVLTSLVAASIPRSTEETLFIPTLLARICQVFGYSSKPSILTANALASLKEPDSDAVKEGNASPDNKDVLLKLIMNRGAVRKLGKAEALFFLQNIRFPSSRIDLDQLITVYFQEWGNVFPLLDKNSFLKNYVKLTKILETGPGAMDTLESTYELVEKFGAIMVLVLSLTMLSSKQNFVKTNGEVAYSSMLKHYDFLIHEFIKPNCIVTKYCLMQSLQILTLSLQYCLVTGDTNTCYELRGRVMTMAQQLRLHRCPAAVLGLSGNGGGLNERNFMQAERRILFWCIYCLDVYASLSLGVPRMLKDFEIECAMPFSSKTDDEDDTMNVNILIINNTRLSVYGKVSGMALSVMLYCKVLGHILDTIYSRYENNNVVERVSNRDRMLDVWRRDLPSELRFEVDVNGVASKDSSTTDGNIWMNHNKQRLTLIFLYYQAKILIFLPILSKYGNHHGVGLSAKENLIKGQTATSTIVASVSTIQQSSLQILEVIKSLSNYTSVTPCLFPIPVDINRYRARLALQVAKGSLDYTKGGPLYHNLKQLLLDTIAYINSESAMDVPGSLSRNSSKLFELSILSILGLNLNKSILTVKKRSPTAPITKTAVPRDVARPKQSSNLAETVPSDSNPRGSITQVNSQEDFTLHNAIDSMMDANFLKSLKTDMKDSIEYGEDLTDGLQDILNFDPFKVNYNPQMMNDFVADGSLGLVPYLENNGENDLAQYEWS